MYNGEPHNVSASDVEGKDRAKPKSAILSMGNELMPTTGTTGSVLALMTKGGFFCFAKY
jgi:hypothetical protein